MKGLSKAVGFLFLGAAILAIGIWGALALFFSGPGAVALRYLLSGATITVAVLACFALYSPHWRWRMFATQFGLFLTLLVWFFQLQPSNDRDWQTDVAALPFATREGDQVTVHNIRNFDYRSETDYTPSYYTKQFNIDQLVGVDLIAVYWMGPAIAHVFLSFDFGGDDHLAISIETRKEKGESYSTLKGFFRQYELYYVVADERDVIRLRTNYRHDPTEDVYVYPLVGPIENARRLFLAYMDRINELHAQPAFYNTLTTNCTTSIWMNTHVNRGRVPFDWRILVSGYLPDYLYAQGRLKSDGRSFDSLRRHVQVNARANAADGDPRFSRRIRE